jgi:hypothetical protein
VCLDAPSPPSYGGAIDMYYKIKSLAAIGKKIILHYFDYNENRSTDGLNEICLEIYRYKRKSFIHSLFSFKAYIIQSRINADLIDRLNADEHSIIFEGLHCSGIIPHIYNQNRLIVRMQNEEATYYKSLSNSEKISLKEHTSNTKAD